MSKRDKKKLFMLVLILLLGLLSFLNERYDLEGVLSGNKNSVVQNSDGKTADEEMYYVHFIDVGQGDSTLFETSEGKYVLVDASTGDAEIKLVSYLRNEGVEQLEYVIFTHPHEDHIGGGDAVLESFEVKNVYMTDKAENTSAFERLVDALYESVEQKGTKVMQPSVGETFSVDKMEFTVLSDGRGYEDLNDASICIKAAYGESGIVITGDAGAEVERKILEGGFDVEAEIMKLGHHGSSSSNSDAFLDAVQPEAVIASCEKDNDYGHPHVEVRRAADKRNIPLYRTDLDGDVVFAFDRESIILPSFED